VARLFVIEAPGKIRALEAILARVGYEARVQATKGHLYQMPDKLTPVGIDSAWREFERKPRDLVTIDWLRKEAAAAHEVFIATDADAEGDVIAWDVAETIKDLHPAPLRVRLKGMDDESVAEAIRLAGPVRKEDAIPGRTRAIVDRLIGAGFSRDGVAVGRVGTALLGLVLKDGGRVRKLRLCAPARDGGRPFMAETEIAAPLDDAMAQRLAALELPALELAGGKPVDTPPPHTGDIMVRAGDRLGLSPGEVAKSMQNLYEGGRLSYPRAGSRGLSSAASRKIEAILKKAGYRVDGSAYAEKSQDDAHDAPYPIGKVDPGQDPTRLGNDEGVRTMIARDLVKAGQKHTEERPVVQGLVPFLRQAGYSEEVVNFVAAMPWRREVGPRYPGQESWPESEVIERRPDTVLLERAIKNGLGRPSTWARHIENFMSRGLVDGDLRLTAKGRAWADASPRALLDVRVSAAIENACEKAPASYMSDPDREPWELNAQRILTSLPPELKQVVTGLVAHEPPRPKVDPVQAYGLDRSAVSEAMEMGTQPQYAPRVTE